MKNTQIAIIIIFLILSIDMQAQKVISLWNETPPSENGFSGSETIENNGGWISNISKADISIFQPDSNNTGVAIIICPGGGYGGLAFNHEGIEFAQWLNTLGITGVVLKYRMPNKHKEIPLDDAHQAIRYIREHAKELNINPNKVGIAGFSAGGHLAATAATHYITSGTNVRPDFSVLFYPVITMQIATHGGSRNNLLGDKPSESELHLYSNEKQVNNNTPPAILLLSDDDGAVSPINSTMYYEALKQNNIPAAIYIFPEGGHGWGMNKNFRYHTEMLSLLSAWLKDIKDKE